MPHSTRVRRSQDSQGKGSKKREAPTATAKSQKKYFSEEPDDEEDEEGGDEELFKVEKIVDHKLDRYGVPQYKTRWKGYGPADDTWEPTANVASTGHVDRYERQLRQKTLTKGSNGVAVIEYEDGEREVVDMKMEKFRSYQDLSGDEDDRDDDTVDGDSDVNDFSLIVQGGWIEILWKHAGMYFPCKIVSWTPIPAKKSQRKEHSKKRALVDDESKKSTKPKLSQPKVQPKKNPKRGVVAKDAKESTKPKSSKQIFDDVKETTEPKLTQIKQNHMSQVPLKTKRGNEVMNRGKSKNASQELPLPPIHNDTDSSEFSTDESDGPDVRAGHGIPLYNEPEGDFDSSDDDLSDDDDDGDGMDTHQHRGQGEGRQKLTFEELWTLKLKRTQDLMYRGGSRGKNGIN